MKKIFFAILSVIFSSIILMSCTTKATKITEFNSEQDVITFLEGKTCGTNYGTIKFEDGKLYDLDGNYVSVIDRIRPNSVDPKHGAVVYTSYGQFRVSCDPNEAEIRYKN